MKKYQTPKVELEVVTYEDILTTSPITFLADGSGDEEGQDINLMFK